MNRGHFDKQIDRLRETFGAQHYRDERVGLIIVEVRDMADEWMTRACNLFIGEFRQAPLLPDFRAEKSKEMERQHNLKKREPIKFDEKPITHIHCDQCAGYGVYFDKEFGGTTICPCGIKKRGK